MEEAHLEFFRMTEVTARISDSRTCLRDTVEVPDARVEEEASAAVIAGERRRRI